MSLIPTRWLTAAFKRRRNRCRATRRRRVLVEQLERRTLMAVVNIAVSATDIQENPANGSNTVTITATADSPVVGDQSVDVIVGGTGIAPGDFALSNATISIPDGQTSGTATFTSVNDSEFEIRETALLELTNLSAGLTAGSNLIGSVDIRDAATPDLEMMDLLGLANALPPTNWANEGDEPCAWNGIGCAGNRVVAMTFVNLDETFSALAPLQFSNISELISLQLRQFNFTGPGPSVDELPNLRVFRFDQNRLSGSLENFSSNLNEHPSLVFINLSQNDLSGPIPAGFLTGAPQIQIELGINHLSGTLPAESLGPHNRLNIRGNMLEGVLPSYAIPSTTFVIDFNMFDVVNTPPIPGSDESWRNTQTVPPTNAGGTSPSDGSADITWTPIAYQADGGYYEVLSSTTPGGPYISRGTTADSGAKTASGLTLTGLPGGQNFFVVRTFTPKHLVDISAGVGGPQLEGNPNDLTSVISEEFMIDLGPLTVGLSASDAVASEIGGDTGTFRLTRDNPNGSLTVNLSLNAASTAAAAEYELTVGSNPPIDVSGASFSVTFPDGSDTLDLTLTALVEPTDAAEPAETITLDLLPGGYFVDGTSNTGTVTITQNGFLVTTDTDGGTGSLRQAVLNANALPGAETISFDASLAGQTITLSGGQLHLTDVGLANRTTIVGPSGGITIDGNNATRLFQINTGVAATIDGLTIVNGFADQGGAILNAGDLTVLNSVLRGNVADASVGAGAGGAISNFGPLNVANTLFHLNTAALGGAINSTDGLTITDSIFSTNQATVNGGGLRLFGTTAITGSTFSNNQAGNGGGGLINHGDLALTNSTFVSNTAVDGGGLQAFAGTVDLRHVTVTSNTATGSGGGLALNSAAVIATNTIIAGNVAASQNDVSGTLAAASSFNLLDQSAAAAGLGTFGNHGGLTFTVALLPASPAINAASAIVGITTDQRGTARPQGVAPDIGAFEFVGSAPAITSTSSTTFRVGVPGSFNVIASGSPAPTFSIAGALPSGVTLSASGMLSGTPAAGSTGAFAFTLTAANGFAPDAMQNFTLNVNEVPSLVVTTVNDVVDPLDGLTSLREAVAFANSSAGADTVRFDAGLAAQTITLSGRQLELTETGAANRTTILGPAGGITVSGNNATRTFQINVGVTATINGLTLIDGFADQGGAIVNFGDLTVLNSVFRNNVADATAGASGGVGGAIANLGPLNVANTLFHLNMGELGGAINSSDGLIVTDSVFSGNQAGFNGGALRLFGTAAITGSTFSNNQAVNGGGGLINHSNLTVTNSTLAFNTASDGGGLQAFSGTADLRNVTITSNTATGSGGGIAASSAVTATNTIIAGNSAANADDLFGSLQPASSSNLLSQSAAAAGLGTFDNHGGTTFTVGLLPGSPAIDAGDPAAVPGVGNTPLFDQRGAGFDRVQAGRVDIGAFEVQNQAPLFTSPTTANVAENATVVHTLTATDADLPAQTIAYSIIGSGADNAQFEIVGGELRFTTAPDFENPTDLGGTAGDNVYEVSVLADDGNGGVAPQTILVTVTDVDEIAPTADIVDITPDPRNTSVGNVTVNFDEAVTNVDITDFVLTRNGQAVDISGLTVSQNTPQQYEIDLSTVTGTDGDYLLTLTQGSDIADTAGNGLSHSAIDRFMIDTVGPQVESVVVNGGDAQRSTVSEITVNFSEIVSVDANSFILMNTTTNTQVVPTVTTQIIGGKLVATLTFSGAGIIGGSLADGDYTLRTLDSIGDSAGNSLDGDKDGSAGGDATDDFFRFFGDINGDRAVNIVDFFQFRNAFFGSPYNAAFDFNGDGMINITDFFQFRSRFGSSL